MMFRFHKPPTRTNTQNLCFIPDSLLYIIFHRMIGLAAGILTMDINVLIFINENISCNCTSVDLSCNTFDTGRVQGAHNLNCCT
jgi:hypothetical protein